MNSKSAKSAAKARQPRTEPEPQADVEISRPGRERRPSDKVAAQLLEQQEADLLKAQKEERRALREKKALQKAKQLANLPSDGEGEYVPRAVPTFVSREVVNKPSQITLGHRSGKVPPAPTVTSHSPHWQIHDDQSQSQQLIQKSHDGQSQHIQKSHDNQFQRIHKPHNDQSQRIQKSHDDQSQRIHKPHNDQSQRIQKSHDIHQPQIDEGQSQRVQQSQIDEGHSQRVWELQIDEGQSQQQTLLVSPAKSVVSVSSTQSELHLGSPVPPPRIKREHVNSDDEDVFEAHVAKAQKISANAGRPKAGDYESSAKEVILSAANTYRALLVSQGAFPTSSEELELVKRSWKRVNEDSEMDPPMGLTPDIVRIIKARGSQARGEAKNKTASLVEALYGFDSGRGKKVIAKNRKIAEDLKSDKGFVFEVLSDSEGKRKGIYKHPILQKAVNAMWFKNKRDEGIIFHDLFNPISVHSIALILTAIECNLDEWISGTKTEVTFWADEYRATYNSHVSSLNSFGKYSKSKGIDLLGQLQRRLYNYGRLHAGISTIEDWTPQAIPQSAFVDAVNDYVAHSETDDEGCTLEA